MVVKAFTFFLVIAGLLAFWCTIVCIVYHSVYYMCTLLYPYVPKNAHSSCSLRAAPHGSDTIFGQFRHYWASIDAARVVRDGIGLDWVRSAWPS